MLFGPIAPRGLPPQNYPLTALLLDRFDRAATAHEPWARTAKRAVEFFEDKQWSDEDKAALEEQGRKALTFNLIKPLVFLVLGYHRNNRTDTKYLPNDMVGTANLASQLTAIVKHLHTRNDMPYVDAEVFLDGLLTGRSFYDARLDFENNDLGDIQYRSGDPFSTFLDPDADTYDPKTWGYVVTSRWASIDEIEAFYGRDAGAYASAFINNDGYSGLATGHLDSVEEVTPARTFGLEEGSMNQIFNRVHERMYDYVDTARRTVRVLDFQHLVWQPSRVFIDLETGRRVLVPDWWPEERIAAVMEWNSQRGDPLRLVRRTMKRIRWTTIIGDIQIWDSWSPFRTYSVVPYFPYFRRGVTKGMVESLLDPQEEVNKRYGAELNIMGRSSAGGWKFPKGSLTPQGKEDIEDYGSTPGLNLEYTPVDGKEPEPIEQQQPGRWWEQVGARNEEKLGRIAGVNESALGQLDRVQSGRAIEARQRQTVVGIEPFMDNYRRTQILKGRKSLEMLQDFYTEPRIFRIQGDDGALQVVGINQTEPVSGHIRNNIGLGVYEVSVDETPISATFLQAVFEELLEMRELGVPIPDEHIIDASSYGRKEELKQAAAEAAAAGNVVPLQPGGGGAEGGQPPRRRLTRARAGGEGA